MFKEVLLISYINASLEINKFNVEGKL